MDFVFLIGSAQGVFLAFLVFNKRKKSLADYFLCVWLFFIGVHLLAAYLFITDSPIISNIWYRSITAPFPALQGPFMLIYTLILIDERPRLKPVYLLHAIPYLLFVIELWINLHYAMTDQMRPSFLEITSTIRSMSNTFLGPVYAITSLIYLRKHKQKISHHFSYTEEVNLRWLTYVIAVTCSIWIMVLISFFLPRFLEFSLQSANRIIYTTLSIGVFFLGYFGIKQPIIYDPVYPLQIPPSERKTPMKKVRYAKSGIKGESSKYLNQLLDFMKVEKPYLESRLTLPMLAQRLNLSTNILSQVINENLNQNFFEFVNQYRVEAVKQCLLDTRYDHLTLLAIALECGFSSKSSFNRIFKEQTGETPSQYKKKLAA